jgi:hypothetical protein
MSTIAFGKATLILPAFGGCVLSDTAITFSLGFKALYRDQSEGENGNQRDVPTVGARNVLAS